MTRQAYATDLTDTQWQKIEPLLPQPKTSGRTGRPREYPYREICNALFYQVRSGCAWRLLPHDLPPWASVYHYFRQWKQDGTLVKLHDILREQVRQQAGKAPTPSAAILDSQSVKAAQKGGPAAMTRASTSRDANATWSWIPSV
jgi:transposase